MLYREYLEKKPGFNEQEVESCMLDFNRGLSEKIQNLRRSFRRIKEELRGFDLLCLSKMLNFIKCIEFKMLNFIK